MKKILRKRQTSKSKLKRIIKTSIILFASWIFVHSVIVTIDGFSDNGENADYAVVLGNKVNVNGTLSTRLEKRMECAVDLYKCERVKGFIVSGGLGKEGHYEGEKMKEYLITQGIPDSLIAVDNYGTNTRNTVANTLAMQDSLQFESIIVVSQYFHITRTKALFRKAGFEKVSGKSPYYFEIRDLHSLLREFVAFYMQCL